MRVVLVKALLLHHECLKDVTRNDVRTFHVAPYKQPYALGFNAKYNKSRWELKVSNENSQTGLKQDEKTYRERERERDRERESLLGARVVTLSF